MVDVRYSYRKQGQHSDPVHQGLLESLHSVRNTSSDDGRIPKCLTRTMTVKDGSVPVTKC